MSPENMKRPLLPTFLFLICSLPAFAQDQHFTQFYAAPLNLNPALTGAFPGKYRIGLIYRDQGREQLGDPYQTFSGAVDLRFNINSNRKRNKDAFGGGILFYNDRNATLNFFTNSMALSGGFHKALGPKGDQYLSLGAQAGITQRNVNYGDIAFSDQFNGADGYTGGSEETLPENNFAFGDLAVGLNYSYAPEQKVGIFAGVALHHILEPEVSFYASEELPEDQNSSPLYMKLSAHLGLQIPIGTSVQVLPRGLYYQQGPHKALNAGSNIRFLFDEINGTALHVGSWVRVVDNDVEQISMDAVVLMAGLEYSNFLLGFSYDARVNSIVTTNTNRAGAFEISLAYLGNYDNDSIQCPTF